MAHYPGIIAGKAYKPSHLLMLLQANTQNSRGPRGGIILNHEYTRRTKGNFSIHKVA